MSTDLTKKLRIIEKVFDVQTVLRIPITEKYVQKYYKVNQWAYSFFHTRSDRIYMGISRNGVYSEEDLSAHAKFVDEIIKSANAKKVLELATGRGANSEFLASANPLVKFFGIDLSPGQLYYAKKRAKRLSNYLPEQGDYHDLRRYKDDEFDIVFVVEALCYSSNKEQVFREVKRILKPGGKFIIFDGYYLRNGPLTDEEAVGSALVEKTMAVTEFELYRKVTRAAQDEGFSIEYEEDVSIFVLPTMRRFERLANIFFKSSFVAKVLTLLLPKEFTYNAIAGYLMPTLIKDGIACYMITVLKKE